MKNGDPDREKKAKQKDRIRWTLKIFFSTIFISILLSFLSSEALKGAGYVLAFIVLAIFILMGIVFDIIGVAVTAGDKKHFHAMASRKVPGAIEALRLLRNADKVSNICNDVVGDICGIISGATSAVVVTRLASSFTIDELIISLLVSGLVAGATVGGKSLGKAMAIDKSTTIVHMVSRVIYTFKSVREKVKAPFRKKRESR